MSNLDDEVGDMMTDYLAENGSLRTYRRGVSSTTMILARQPQRPIAVEVNGHVIEVLEIAWTCRTDALPYGDPVAGDQIDDGSVTYEVLPTTGSKCFRQLSPQLTRIHTKQIG